MANNNSSHSGSSGGIGFVGALQLAFIIMKLTKLIKWSWLWVLFSTWISAGLFVLLVILVSWLTKRE